MVWWCLRLFTFQHHHTPDGAVEEEWKETLPSRYFRTRLSANSCHFGSCCAIFGTTGQHRAHCARSHWLPAVSYTLGEHLGNFVTMRPRFGASKLQRKGIGHHQQQQQQQQ